jgi:outer membrane protein assembly factor BamB
LPHDTNSNIFYTILNTISTVNRVVSINWTVNSLRNIKAFKIYRGTATNPTTKIDSISSASLTYKDSVTNGVKYYYRVTAVNTDNIESLYSNELFANSFGVTVLDSPSNNKVKEILKPTFKWQSVEFATKYNIQISTSSLFANTPILDTVTSLTSLLYAKGLSDNTTYFWRIRVGDDKGYGNWTSKSTFQTYVLAPTLLSVAPSNKIDTLKWSVLSSSNIKYFKIYRDTVNNPIKLIDSINSTLRLYIDTTKLNLNQKYYYRITTGNNENIESDYSNIIDATPFNTKPRAIKFSDKNYNNVGEFNYVRTTYSSTGSVDIDGKIVDFKWYVNDSLVNSVDSILVYYYNQGSNKVKLVLTDNDGGKDSTSAIVSLSSFTKTFKGGFLGGITALSQNLIYTADSTFDPVSGASITMLDRAGNTIYPLVVSSKIFTTPSVSSDSSVFITSGSSLNGFNKSGAPLWSTIPLGGLSYVTPTIDSLLTRIYVGVSNKNFFAIDYKTGKVAWSIFGDAPINSSAVITGDRKLVFTSQSGTLYGFDIRTNAVQTSPKWTSNFGEVITKSPAVDGSNNLIIGTQTGKVLKVKLNSDGTITRIWTIDIASEIQASPVIDADGFLYVGNKLGDFYKLNPDNGATIWKYATGAAIKSTPTISEFGTLYVSNVNGLVTALKTDKTLKWTYQADGAVSANMLYISNMLYIGTESGKFFAIYDNPNTNTVNTGLSININKNNFTSYSTGSLASVIQSTIQPEYQYYYESFKNGTFNFTLGDQVVKPKKPIWGTFQGNNQRTGSAEFECPAVPIISIPNCTEFADSIKITTSNLTDKYWIVNDKTLNTITDTIISVKSTDKYKLMAYNANGCNVYSNENIFIPNSTLAKPKIVTSNGGTKFCEGDSIVLSSNINTAKYQWNFSSSPVTDATAKNLSTTLQGAYSVTAINEFGCKATSDLALILTTPKPAVAAIDGVNALCIGATSKLTNATVGGVWSSGAETIVIVDASGNISPVAAGTGVINYTITANGCSNTSKINIKVNETPVAPKADNVALCIGGTSSSLIANASGGYSLLWYGSNATGGQSSGTAPTPVVTSAGTTSYYVSQSNNNTTCESPRTKITVIVNTLPAAPVVSGLSLCSGVTTSALNATAITGNSLLWYGVFQNGGASSSAAPMPSTSTVGSTDYYVSQTDGVTGCESPRSKLSVTINAAPLTPSVTSMIYCAGTTATSLIASSESGNTLKWYGTTATGGTSSNAAPIPVITSAGVISYYVSQSNTSSGCEGPRAKLTVTVNETPVAPKADNVALCVGGTSSSLIANASGGYSLLWYGSNATGGQSSGTAPIPTTNAQGSTDYYVSQSNNSTTCESPRTKITVSVGPAPATPTITRDANGNLTSSATSGNQWYKNGAEIIGATSTLYKPTEVANYAVKIQGVCVSPMSTIYYFLITDVINLSATEFIKLAPNPFQNKLNFDFVIKGYQKLNLDVFELATGRKVTSRVGLTPGSPVYLPELSGGTYIVRITSADGKLSYQFKMMKL